MSDKRFLDIGSPLEMIVVVLKATRQIRITNPDKLAGSTLPIGTFARIHSETRGVYTVWLLDEVNMNTIIVEVPLVLMAMHFKQHPHKLFSHFV